ncbi:hypothetical protein V6N11_030620 [Hibiscus sabdariffa]|uniref:Reverse transcriptase zinc-binding domain-containing protein n=2 Tax=Hibiscus sabdariffa TaxID=183260 RepID=A0ABR1ZPB5_9ROSI
MLLCSAAKKVSVTDGSIDQLGWKLNTDRRFTVKSTYEMWSHGMATEVDPVWAAIHKFQGFPRIKMFLWLACKEKLMTNIDRVCRGFTMDASCPRYRMESEDVNHLLRGYGMSVTVWSLVVKPS